jgi:hypothetical protein
MILEVSIRIVALRRVSQLSHTSSLWERSYWLCIMVVGLLEINLEYCWYHSRCSLRHYTYRHRIRMLGFWAKWGTIRYYFTCDPKLRAILPSFHDDAKVCLHSDLLKLVKTPSHTLISFFCFFRNQHSLSTRSARIDFDDLRNQPRNASVEFSAMERGVSLEGGFLDDSDDDDEGRII